LNPPTLNADSGHPFAAIVAPSRKIGIVGRAVLTGGITVNISPLPPATGHRACLASGVWWFPTSNGVDRPGRFSCCGRESEIDRLGGFPVSRQFGRFFDNLVLKKEKRGRRGLCGRHFGGVVKETSDGSCISLRTHNVAIRFSDRMDDGVTSSKCVNPVPEKVLIQPESLILAQNERWRQA
jgi:hypothetical protein